MRRLEPSGSRLMAARRILRRGAVTQRRMQPTVVVVVPKLASQHFRLQHAAEAFAVEELVAEAAVEALAISILPRAAGFDEERFEAALRHPVHHRLGDELGAIVAADILGHRAALGERLVQDPDHIRRAHRSFHLQGHALAGELIADRQPLEPPAVLRFVEHEIVTPDLVGRTRPQQLAARCGVSTPSLPAPLAADFEPFGTPNPQHPLWVDRPARTLQGRRGRPVAGPRAFAQKLPQLPGQVRIPVGQLGSVPLGRARRGDQSPNPVLPTPGGSP